MRCIVLSLLALWHALFAVSALAQGVCAEVRLEIPQQLSLERQAFSAQLGISNAVDAPITGFGVVVEFKDDQGNAVLATSNPNNTSAVFFIRIDNLVNVTGGITGGGVIAAQSQAEVNWLIVPSVGAGGTTAAGKLYYVGATVTYMQGGQPVSLAIEPDSITVQPQPLLKIDYFLTRDVYSDDPFTPVVEPAEPFTLGVRIKNIGAGVASKVKIESAQPRITENAQGLNINFNVIDSYVGNTLAQPSLLINFGDIASGTSTVGRWNMTASLTGTFTEFDADYTHDDSVGGALTSLIDSVTAHSLVKDVIVDLAGRDTIRDFLALDGDTLRVYESEGTDLETVDRSSVASLTLRPDGKYSLLATPSTLPTFIRVVDPTNGNIRIAAAARLNGTTLPAENIWLSKVRQGTSTNFTHYINVFDVRGDGGYIISVLRQDNGSIGGRVFRDDNDNGLIDPLERGLEAASVRLTGTAVTGAVIDQTVQTNNLGNYAFNDLFAGSYAIAVGNMPGLRNGTHTAGTASGQVGATGVSEITLPINDAATGYLLAKVPLTTTPQADLALALNNLSPSIGVGELFDIEVKLRNNGPDAAPATVQLFAQTGLDLVSATPDVGTYDPVTRRWSVANLLVQGRASLVVRVRANAPGTRTFRATVSSTMPDPVTPNNEISLAVSAAAVAGDLIFRDGFEEIVRTPKTVIRVFEVIGAAGAASNAGANASTANPTVDDGLHEDGLEPGWGGFEAGVRKGRPKQ